MVHTCKASPWKAEAGTLEIQDHPWLHFELEASPSQLRPPLPMPNHIVSSIFYSTELCTHFCDWIAVHLLAERHHRHMINALNYRVNGDFDVSR